MTEYHYKTCPVCGINYAVDAVVMRYKNEAAQLEQPHWYCPNGHQLVFVEREADILRRERDRLKQQLAERDDAVKRAEQETARLKKRINAGVCPCCSRTFSNVARHMKTKHPNVVPIGKKRA